MTQAEKHFERAQFWANKAAALKIQPSHNAKLVAAMETQAEDLLALALAAEQAI